MTQTEKSIKTNLISCCHWVNYTACAGEASALSGRALTQEGGLTQWLSAQKGKYPSLLIAWGEALEQTGADFSLVKKIKINNCLSQQRDCCLFLPTGHRDAADSQLSVGRKAQSFCLASLLGSAAGHLCCLGCAFCGPRADESLP